MKLRRYIRVEWQSRQQAKSRPASRILGGDADCVAAKLIKGEYLPGRRGGGHISKKTSSAECDDSPVVSGKYWIQIDKSRIKSMADMKRQFDLAQVRLSDRFH
jgi:hypothetical protein